MTSRVIDLKHDPAHPEPKLPVVFGLMAPTGTKMDLLERKLKKGLTDANRTVRVVSMPDILRAAAVELGREVPGPEDERITALRQVGILLRKRSQREPDGKTGDILAVWALKEIQATLESLPTAAAAKAAFVVRSLKHPDEAKLLRSIFGPWFFLIAGYSPASVRLKNLEDKIFADHKRNRTTYRVTAGELSEADEGNPDEPLGPQVKATFHLADAFIDVNKTEDDLIKDVTRLMKVVFGQLLQTPTPDEAAMALAHTAALESGFLSRQVGAVVTMPESGEIVATGYNEVPKFGGGPYLTTDKPDERDNARGEDKSYVLKEGLVQDTLARLVDAEWIAPDLLAEVKSEVSSEDAKSRKAEVEAAAEKLATRALAPGAPLARSEAMDVLEFHRAVHAEQAAISSCAGRGVSTKGKWLYVTTFPCHICAKHIIAAGIERVIYVEPYPKSYAAQLHGDAIKVDPKPPRPARGSSDKAPPEPEQLAFEPFMGIAPRRYEQLFIVRPGERRGPGGLSSPENAWELGIPRWETLWEFQPSYTELRKRIEEAVKGAPSASDLSDESSTFDTSEDEEDA